jgi:hypothetical protein
MRPYIAVFIAFVLTVPALADYTYVMTEGMDFVDLGTSTLTGYQTLLMTGGGGGLLDLTEYSSAVIQGTDPYNQDIYPRGGIHDLTVADYANLDFSGGDIYEINIGSYGTAVLSGGNINRLRTGQSAWRYDYTVDPPVLVPNPHVEMIVKEWNYIAATNILSGLWGNDSTFNIQLVDVSNYSPTIDNIKFTFIPEPISFLLLGLGCLIVKRKK